MEIGEGELVETFGERERGLVRGFSDGERQRDERPCEWEKKTWYLGIKY